MASARRKRAWLLWSSVAGLVLTLALAAYSELNAVSYRENTYGVPNRFLLYRSSVTVVYRPGPDNVLLTGFEVFQPGWSIARFVPRDAYLRTWIPRLTHENAGSVECWLMILPLWIPAAVFAAGIWYGRRGGWVGDRVCVGCGYDLSGLAGAVCPECGKADAAAP